ncbi:MAG: hypothetical protein V2B15_02420 [Bacteroidota bacterium]
MRKLAIIFIITSMGFMGHGTVPSHSQAELVWLGLDYTQVKFIGYDTHFTDIPKIRDHYFASWNELIVLESDKYDVKGALGVKELTYEIEKAINRSRQRDMSGVLQSSSYELGKDQLAGVLKAYINASDPRTGALMIMETLNKLDETSAMWLVVFDVATSEIHHLKKYTGKPGGFGFRNYWARCYYNVLLELKNTSQKPL